MDIDYPDGLSFKIFDNHTIHCPDCITTAYELLAGKRLSKTA